MRRTYTHSTCESADQTRLRTSVMPSGSSNYRCLSPFFYQKITLVTFLPALFMKSAPAIIPAEGCQATNALIFALLFSLTDCTSP